MAVNMPKKLSKGKRRLIEKNRKLLKANPDKITCESCGKKFYIYEISYGPDPYQSDVNNDFTPHWLCEKCRHESVMDI